MVIAAVSDEAGLKRVEQLARGIWHEHYTPIIGEAQVVYMLETYQSTAAMRRQLDEGYRYYLLSLGNDDIGYMAVQPQEEALFLSKFYLKASQRGLGFGRKALAFLETVAAEKGLEKIVLTVNKNNSATLEAYKKLGFVNVASLVQAIGNGFVMDDYKMEKRLAGADAF